MKVKYRINLTKESSGFLIFTTTSFFIPVFLTVFIIEAACLYFGLYLPLENKIRQVKKEHQRLVTKLHALERERILNIQQVLDTLVAERFNWTEKMAFLGKILPSGIYLTEIKVEEDKHKRKKRRFLVIKGIVVSSSRKDPADAVGKLIQRLNNAPQFLQGLKPIELRGIQPVPKSKDKFMFELAGEYVRS